MAKNRWFAIASAVAMVALFGCDQQAPTPPASAQPPAEQKVVMVPSWKEGAAAKADGSKAEAAAPPVNSTPDGPQPGEKDYTGK